MRKWDRRELRQLVTFQKGRKVEVSDHQRPGFAPYLGANVISGGEGEYADTRGAVLASQDDVLMLWDGERSGLVGMGRPGVVSSTVARLSPREGMLGRFLFYALALRFEWIQNRRTGTGVPHVPKDLGRILQVAFPTDRLEQHRIAEILSAIDDAIGQTEALIAKTQETKAGLMHDLFARGVTADGHVRPPREKAPKLYKKSPLGWIPNEWEAGRLVDKRGPGRPHLKTGPFGSSLKLEHWVEEGSPVITIGALGEGKFITQELLHVSEATAERLREYQLEVGDVVFSRVADVGRSAAISDEQKGWIMSSNLMRISLDRRLVIPAFLQAQLAYDARVRRQIRATVNAGGRDVANSQILNRLNFAWPPKDEQERIVARLDGIENYRRSNVSCLEKLRLEKAGLMHDLLSGRVRVPIADAQKGAGVV